MPLDAAATDHLEWALAWGWAPRTAVFALAVALLALSAVNLRPLTSLRRRSALFALRALTVASLVVALHQPTWVKGVDAVRSRHVAVVVDRSASMQQGRDRDRRWERAAHVAESLAQLHEVEVHATGVHSERLTGPAALAHLQPDARATDLLAALRGLAAAGRPLGAVVIVSDGLDNAAIAARNPRSTAPLDAETAELLERLAVPVHSVLIRDRVPPRDLAVATVRCAGFGFTRTVMPVSIDVEVSGYEGRTDTFSVVLSDNGRPVATRAVPLQGPPRRTLELELQPLHVGMHLIEATIIDLPDEATIANNRAWSGTQVVRDRMRVLHLAGHPSWDTRFLRTQLRGNPGIDLVSFYVMVGQGSGAYVADDDTTLIPFPTREIFEDSLQSFDLVVFQDFPFGPFQVQEYLPQLRSYVTGGGAFFVIGGPQALSAGGYYGSALADWLPLRLAPLHGDDEGFVHGSFPLRLTPAGEHHAVTVLDVADNAAAWSRHMFTGRNTGLQAGEGGSVLATDAEGNPLIAVGEVGDGRSAVVATDSLWTWAFPASAGADLRDRSRRDYHRLVDRLMAWLLRDPELDPVRIEAPVEAVAPGVPSEVRVVVHDAAGQPQVGAPVRFGLQRSLPAAADPPSWTAAPATDARGETMLVLRAHDPGPWLLTVEATMGGRPQRAVAPISVDAGGREMARLQPEDRLLRLLARASGGQVWHDRPPRDGVPLARAAPTAASERVHIDLWAQPPVLLWLVALLVAEWLLRRRWGLA